jgi:hypothetical protein
MARLPSTCMKTALFILLFCFLGFYSSVTISIAQSTYTSSVTQPTTIFSTNTILTTITSPTIAYTTTTETLNSTAQGIQTLTQTSVTTVTLSYTTILGGTLTQTITSVVTEVSTQTTPLLGNIWGESLALVLLLSAIASFLVPRALSLRPRGSTCSGCGYRNPPFAKSFCVKCGHSLEQE